MKDKIDILVTLDENYTKPLKVLLYSIYQNNPGESFRIWIVNEDIPTEKILEIKKLTDLYNWELYDEKVSSDFFSDAPTIERYPKEMYYRLLSGEILPKHITKVLYLDPDILVINPLRQLWETDLEGNMIAAASHTGITGITKDINNIRLGTTHSYFNSGIMLIDLDKARELIHMKDISEALNKYSIQLILPDQDLINLLYGYYIKEVPEELWNYDTRKYLSYFTKSLSEHDIHWVMKNTSILHFCGRPKPWDEKSDDKFTALYLDYQTQLERLEESLNI